MSKRFYWKKIKPILLSVVICSIFFLVLIAITSNRTGNMTIFVDRSSVTKSLSLSESSGGDDWKGKLEAPVINNAWDFDGRSIPEDLNMKDGNNSGENYIAYTFFVKNSGVEKLDYSMNFKIDNQSKDLAKAIRVKLYVGDEATTYAFKDSENPEIDNETTDIFMK